MSVHYTLAAFALWGIPVGLTLGLALGLIARSEGGMGGYASFRRRAARLGHVAAVMLPALGGLYSLLLRAVSAPASGLAEAGACLWISGGIALPLCLFAAAWRPGLTILIPLPALAVLAGAVALAAAGLPPS